MQEVVEVVLLHNLEELVEEVELQVEEVQEHPHLLMLQLTQVVVLVEEVVVKYQELLVTAVRESLS
jgi:hypothetical protein